MGKNKPSIIIVLIVFACLYVFLISKRTGQEKGYVTESGNTQSREEINEQEDIYYLPVVETTDIHGYIVDISSGDEGSYQYRLGYIANEINKMRNDGDILLLDTGDCYQGNVISNQLMGEPVTAYIDAMEYDAVCLGNHEFDWGLDATIDHDGTVGSYDLAGNIRGDSKVPVLCWNLYDSKSGDKVDYTRDYIIVDKVAKTEDGREKDCKIAIFGYVNDYSSSIAKKLFKGYEIREDDIEEIENMARELEDTNSVDASILVCHVSPEDMDGLLEENTAIDFVFCGHDHKNLQGEFENNTHYIDGGCYGQAYGVTTLAINDEGLVWAEDEKIVSVTDIPALLYDVPENRECLDEKIMKISRAAIDELNEKSPDIMKKLGYITTSISDKHLEKSIGEDVATTFAASLIANAVGTPVGIINSTGVRCELKIPKGMEKRYITGADIYSMFPFGNSIIEYELTYDQLFKLCTMTELNGHSYLGISGVTAYFENGDSDRLGTLYLGDKKIYDNGWTVDNKTKVVVAVNEYVAGFDNYCFKNLTPVNDYKKIVDSEKIIQYLDEEYGENREIKVDTDVHFHDTLQ